MPRTKRRRKFTWFPVRGSAPTQPEEDDFSQLLGFFPVSFIGGSSVFINPLIPDSPMEGDEIDPDAPGQLVQAIGQEYIVERIVGKCFLSVAAAADDPPTVIRPKVILITCGIFVARANDADVGGGANTPVGSASLIERIENYAPGGVDAIREPWMWRRAWILSSPRRQPVTSVRNVPFHGVNANNIDTSPFVIGGGGAPNTNIGYGSVLDGPHFDVKSVRRVRTDERLWFVIQTRSLDREFAGGNPAPNTSLNGDSNGGVGLVLDFRVLGALRKAQNRGTF